MGPATKLAGEEGQEQQNPLARLNPPPKKPNQNYLHFEKLH